jgi:energy-coupling factor transporter transmembrane protein EcfT
MKNNGLGFGSILFLLFLTLKLTNNIQWSWLWVFSPLWIPIVLIGLAVVTLALTQTKK